MSVLLTKSLSQEELARYTIEYNEQKKNATTGVLLALFLGGFGAHHFYMGNTGVGIVYLLFFWTFIPAVIALVECFLMSSRMKTYNDQISEKIVIQISAMRTNNSIQRQD
ncbi:MAG: TM2 domain-containing protein [Gammaproteobacteria bacterium]|nr:TM2 domain-containing protein [Gammaproteobacteria bacterium]